MTSAAFLVVATVLAFVLLFLGEPGLALLAIVVLTLGLAFEDRR